MNFLEVRSLEYLLEELHKQIELLKKENKMLKEYIREKEKRKDKNYV